MTGTDEPLNIIVVGASGDLARKKVFPALFALYCQGLLPRSWAVFGFARSAFSHQQFRDRIAERLSCRYAPGASCEEKTAEFLSRCFYCEGAYDAPDAFLNLYTLMREKEGGVATNRMFYLAVPPSVFLDVATALGGAGLVQCGARAPWSRIVIEKPFGKDRASSDALTRQLAEVFTEEQTYRIDHYLGKELIQNLMVLRFANLVFEPVWNNAYIERVNIDWKEDIGVEGRGGYYDNYGIIRDVVQNHLLQILALIAMERPVDTEPRHIRDEKVRVLRAISPVALNDVLIGQYVAAPAGAAAHCAYVAEEGVPENSLTATYAALVLRVQNERWAGVPFFVKAGKALDERISSVRIRFKSLTGNIFCEDPNGGCLAPNELCLRIQPDEALSLSIVNKEPGLRISLARSDLNLRYQTAFRGEIPDAYERLLLDVIHGDKSLFIRADELVAAWDIFTPVLHEIEKERIRPRPYPFGSQGPGVGSGAWRVGSGEWIVDSG